MKSERIIPCRDAICEATHICMERDPSVFIMGLGVPDVKGIFGTTLGLKEKFGETRAFECPTSENAMTGVAIGSAITGMRPILTHQRVDFALLSMEQIVNQAAKWHYMFNGKMKVPLVIRMIIGRGWGQGPQHSQSLASWFAHIPGLKVVMPATAYDAKGLLIASIEDDNPVIFMEHRWMHHIKGNVPEGHYTEPIGKAKIARKGKDLTIVANSYMTIEALRAAKELAQCDIEAEVIDLRSIAPLDIETIYHSVRKTNRLIIADIDHLSFGIGSEIITRLIEKSPSIFTHPPERISLPDHPVPTSHFLASEYYPTAKELIHAAQRQLNLPPSSMPPSWEEPEHLDIPDKSFTGPF